MNFPGRKAYTIQPGFGLVRDNDTRTRRLMVGLPRGDIFNEPYNANVRGLERRKDPPR